jgi:DNA polymerase-1
MRNNHEVGPKEKILVIDGYHLLHKGYYGSLKRKKILCNREGQMLNALCVFAAKILEYSGSGEYRTVIVTFDVASGDCWRRQLYPNYKATRKETPEDLRPQMQLVRDLLTAARIPWYEKASFEGDDVMGTISRIANKLGYVVEIMSNDKDIYQLVNEDTVVITQKSSRSDREVVRKEEVFEAFNCSPRQIPDMKSLMGDNSDNIKGVCGLHYSTATQLISKYGSVERCFSNIDEIDERSKNLLLKNKERILINKKIATIQKNVDIGRIDFRPLRLNYKGFLWFVRKQRMWPFVKRIEAMLGTTCEEVTSKVETAPVEKKKPQFKKKFNNYKKPQAKKEVPSQ